MCRLRTSSTSTRTKGKSKLLHWWSWTHIRSGVSSSTWEMQLSLCKLLSLIVNMQHRQGERPEPEAASFHWETHQWFFRSAWEECCLASIGLRERLHETYCFPLDRRGAKINSKREVWETKYRQNDSGGNCSASFESLKSVSHWQRVLLPNIHHFTQQALLFRIR